MSGDEVGVTLNQQQLQLLDDTVARFPGKRREDILLQALREYCAEHGEVTTPAG
jgi:metal-responsive CopG/Arc/MetJ family transcriptional regulator